MINFIRNCNRSCCSITLVEPGAHWSLGTASASHMQNNIWFVNRVLITNEDKRGQGWGTILLQELQREVLQQGCEELLVTPGGYDSDPQKQIKFYLKGGFVFKEDGLYSWKLRR